MSENEIGFSSVASELKEAYRATHFNVLEPASFTLRIGSQSRDLSNLYQNYNISTAAFITAWNPFSNPTPEHENARMQRRLEKRLHELSIAFFPGMGEDPSGEWPGEPSVLALGVSREAAIGLGREFRQNAIVWIDADCIPDLLFLR